MSVAYVVLAVLLSLVLVVSGRGKLVRDEEMTRTMTRLGVPRSWFPVLALLEFAGALGLLVGIGPRPLGVAAAVGVTLYFTGAVVTHLRAKDAKGTPVPLVLALVAAAALVTGLASA
ncbi:DoxX family protein [Streptomyces sp. TRM 70351]|uniref:DoxX family protein n=1 Tax=Streptomyces sp. TRM 70351 TaxID=3116552 RepID=UPI002E7AC133|nr:DoxX family protein [Streptomyces sp. TRM 70351]MEE1930111.1 DoxX family protein [Streptomyces sp. TRM 70351]